MSEKPQLIIHPLPVSTIAQYPDQITLLTQILAELKKLNGGKP